MEVWRQYSKDDFDIFEEEVLGFENAEHHKEWCDILSNKKNRRIVLAAPRGHTKTTKFSVNYPAWEIANDPNVRILLVSAADIQSQSFLREIKGRIERDQDYVDYAGQLKPQIPEKWTDKEIILNRSRKDIKDPTISTVSVEGTILSKRADIIICDDILNFENTRTPEQRQKIKEWFNLVLMPVLEPTGRLIVVGTIWQLQDLMMDLIADPTFDYRKKYRAIISEPTHKEMWDQWCSIYIDETLPDRKEKAQAFLEANRERMHEGIKVLWPQKFTYETLYMIRYSDPYAFARAYQNDPASRPNQSIKNEWIAEALRKGAGLRLQDAPRTEYTDLTTEGMDLAISQKDTADDSCKLTLDMIRYDWNGIKAGSFIIRQIKRGKFTPKENRDMVVTDYYIIKPDGIRVETVQYQEAFKRDLEDNNIPVRGHRTGSEKHDSAVGVNSLAILLEQGKLVLPSDPQDPRTRDLVGLLCAEMRAYPEDHTGDSLMALWLAYLEMRDLLGTRYTIPSKPIPVVMIPPPNTPDRKAEEKKADEEVIGKSEQERARVYWKQEERRMMNAGAKRVFGRR